MPGKITDVCVVGAGIFGLSAAIELKKRGYSVCLLDREKIPASLAASTDISKIVRIEYGPDIQYMEMAELALKGWRECNQQWSETLFHETGVAMMTNGQMQKGEYEFESYQLLNERGHSPLRLDRELIKSRFPAWKNSEFSDGYYHALGGYVESGEVIKKLYESASKISIEILPQTEVLKLLIRNNTIEGIQTDSQEKIIANKVLICAGSWTHILVDGLETRMRSTGHPVFHLEVRDPEQFQADRFPVFTADISKTGWYGFPLHPKKNVIKIANHGVGLRVHPSFDDRKVLEIQERKLLEFISENLPTLNNASIVYRRLCLYSDTRDEHFWIDKHPDIDGLFVAAGGSGHGFKFGPILGPLISDCIEQKENKWLPKFQWRSFKKSTSGEEAARHHES